MGGDLSEGGDLNQKIGGSMFSGNLKYDVVLFKSSGPRDDEMVYRKEGRMYEFVNRQRQTNRPSDSLGFKNGILIISVLQSFPFSFFRLFL